MTTRLADAEKIGTLAEDATWDVSPAADSDRSQSAAEARSVLVVSADGELRERLASSLTGLRWRVREAGGGAQAMMHLESRKAEAMLVDYWLPDLEVREFMAYARLLYPEMELLCLHGGLDEEGGGRSGREGLDRWARSPRRNELLHAMRQARDGAGEPGAHAGEGLPQPFDGPAMRRAEAYRLAPDGTVTDGSLPAGAAPHEVMLPELVGESRCMQEVAKLVRMVAPRSTTVLIEGETGTGKEVVARALHRLSRRAAKPFVVLNCAAIPESLLEAELFGHIRGAFTGAVQSRLGRIEMADGGTLLLDEIGEMPVGMQAKMLRFLESGELQRVGDNETRRVDVRLIAATHRPLEEMSVEGLFRLDLYHRLAVFPIQVPPLRERMEDIEVLAEHFLKLLGRDAPRKQLTAEAVERLLQHSWPGNVRELMHVLERGMILAGAKPEIAAADIRYRRATRD
jgi:DNA-binding NtrC family response regulator